MVYEGKILLLGDKELIEITLEVLDSIMILMNSGHVDWRTFKINIVKRHKVPAATHFSMVNSSLALLVSPSTSTLVNLG